MITKQNVTSSKQTLQSLRARYTWQLQPPFNKQFDARHWWEGQAHIDEIDPVGALYELARRHPVVGEVRRKFCNARWHGMELYNPSSVGKANKRLVNLAYMDIGNMPDAIYCLCLIGLKTWEKLNPRERDYWEDAVGSIKGLDCRSDLQQCCSINNEVLTDILLGFAKGLKRKCKGKTAGEINKLYAYELLKSKYPDDKYEADIAKYAISALRNNYLLIAVARDLKADEAASLLEQRYREHQALHRIPKQRARHESWLPLISEFENDEIGHKKAKSQVFIRYRRSLDLIHFATGGQGIHNERCRHILAARNFFLQEIYEALAKIKAEKRP
jgi:hypothetical protein